MTATNQAVSLLRMSGISKSFPGVRALESVNFEVGVAEIHAFLGENGAGKSTLLKILSGAQAQDAGSIFFNGNPASFASPQRLLESVLANELLRASQIQTRYLRYVHASTSNR